MFVFVRQDISLPQQIVQSNHAVLTMASRWRVQGIPNIIVIGVPDSRSLNQVKEKLDGSNVGHLCWHEPDGDLGFTSICTQPLTREEKQFLANYRLWQPIFRGSSNAERAVPNPDREMLARTQPPEPNPDQAPVAQWQSGDL